MKLTTNYSLKKPEGSDVVNIDDFNYNADLLDNKIKTIENQVSTNKNNISTLQSEVSANKASIQSVNTKITNNTTLANQALAKANEAFQRGDNVKTQLVDKLISEGLNVSTNNTFEELIGNIALGKKFAIETVNKTFSRGDTFISCNLSFVPSIIFMKCGAIYIKYNGAVQSHINVKDATITNNTTASFTGASGIYVTANIINISKNGFTLSIGSDSTFIGYIDVKEVYAFE